MTKNVMVECGLVGATTFHLVYPAFQPAYSGVAEGFGEFQAEGEGGRAER